MLIYRLHPHSPLEWSDFPIRDLKPFLAEHDVDLDRWEWKPTEARGLTTDLLRIALRYGVATKHALVVEGIHTTNIGRADELRANQRELDELHEKIRTSQAPLMESLMPGWTTHSDELDQRVRESTDNVAREADEELAEELSVAVDQALVEHWSNLGGTVPTPA